MEEYQKNLTVKEKKRRATQACILCRKKKVKIKILLKKKKKKKNDY